MDQHAVLEMERRLRILAEQGVRNIDQYNALLKDPEALRRAKKSAEDAPIPEPGEDEHLIRVERAGINFADTMARVGLYPEAPKPPCVVGYEVAGEVESLGEGVDSVARFVVVAGGSGKHSAVVPNCTFSRAVSKAVETPG